MSTFDTPLCNHAARRAAARSLRTSSIRGGPLRAERAEIGGGARSRAAARARIASEWRRADAIAFFISPSASSVERGESAGTAAAGDKSAYYRTQRRYQARDIRP